MIRNCIGQSFGDLVGPRAQCSPLQSAGATALGGAAALVNFTSAPARCARTQLGAGKAKKRVLCNRETFAFSQLRKFGPILEKARQLMSLGCRYSEAMIRIRHTHRAALRKSRHIPMSVGSMSLCSFLWFSCIHPRVLFCVFMLLCEHEAISLLGEVHLPCPRDSKCPTGCSGHVDIQSTVQA